MKRQHLGLRIVMLAITLVIGSMQSQAQYKPVQFIEYDLANGMHVILHEDHSAPVVATVVQYKVGSRDEDPARTGFAHFFEHLMFESTDKIDRGTIDKLVNGAGGELNAFTSQDQTVYHFVVPSNEVRLALWIEAQRMRKLHIDKIGVETQRGVVKEERKNRYDNAPYGGMLDKLMAGTFSGTPYSWSTIGSAQHIDSAAISEFKGFYDKFYQPNNAILVVAGDFDESVVRETIDAYFGGYAKATEPSRPVFAGLQPMNGETKETINDPRAQLPAVFIGMRGVGMKDPDSYAADLLAKIMSNGESSRLYKALVDSAQISVNADLSVIGREYGGLVLLIGIAAPGKDITPVEQALLAQVAKVAEGGVSEEELTKAKNQTETEFVQSRMGAYQIALSLSNAYRYFGSTNEINEELAKYLKVTKADIQRVAKRLFQTNDRVVITYIPVKG